MTTVTEVIATGVLLGLIYTLAALGLQVSLGVLRVLNLAHGIIVIAGAFFAFDLLHAWHITPLLAVILALPVFFLFGLVLDRGLVQRVRRVSEQAVLLGLFGAMILLQSLAILTWTTDSRSITVSYTNSSVTLAGVTLPADYLVAAAAALVILGIIAAALRFTMAGRAVQALAQNPEAARVLGVNVDRWASIVFGLSVAVAGMSGVLLADVFPFSVQEQSQWLAYAFIVVLVGGTGGIRGALVGGLVLGLAQSVFNQVLPLQYVDVVVYGLLAAALIVRGGGLASRRERAL
ncbi:MAG TPA: branched-chain amino acid ABC transporter permease [Streptosporangiaceae bacterium]|nr:branched-chain amino acid ABC transporter permease [Streptosporangiaceae bacterium]